MPTNIWVYHCRETMAALSESWLIFTAEANLRSPVLWVKWSQSSVSSARCLCLIFALSPAKCLSWTSTILHS